MNKIQIRKILTGVMLGFWCVISYADDSSLRTLFLKWQVTYRILDMDAQKKQLNELTNYPLYPYAEYQYLNQNINNVSSDDINQFINKYNDLPLAPILMQNYIESLTKQNEWEKITALKIDGSLVSRCRYQYALLQQGSKDEALKSVANIWLSGDDLPSACNPLFDEWNKAGNKTTNIILLRIELVLQKNNLKLARYLTDQLPDNYKTLKKNLFALYDNPSNLANYSKNVSPSSFSKNIAMSSFPRLANKDPELAKSLIPNLIKRYKLSKADETTLLRSIALNYFKDSATEEQAKWRDQFIEKNRDTNLVERNIRSALRQNKMDEVEHWINLLSSTDKQKDEWRYWQAILLMNKNKTQEANVILKELTKERGFYAMYSAQKLNQPFTFDFKYSVTNTTSAKAESTFLKNKYGVLPVIKRIEELRFLGMQKEANAEWRYYLYSTPDERQYNEIARYAYLKDWGEHSVQATIAGKLWNNWLERFPLMYKSEYDEFIKDKSIKSSYALAITRQESALDATATSPVGARGLMQLMPGTAKDTAKKITGANYNAVEQLYDPKMNIQLGTSYLDYVYQLFDNNRVLASAAYNAGPNRVNRWLKDSAGDIDVIAFIESIPFTETRNYVKSVLVYDYIYQVILQEKPNTILNDNELKQSYHR